MLETLIRMAETSKRSGSLIEALVVKAGATASMGDTDGARASLERALMLAEPEAYVRIFVDEGKPVETLLGQIYQGLKRGDASVGISRDYIERLLLAFRTGSEQREGGEQSTASRVAGLVEPFSERELEVIRLLSTGLSNKEIAVRLFVALSTIKWHVNNIYGKLNAKNRTQAISRARDLGMV
jgi:LuxR family maltose regulon positive regulatory protein